MIPKGIVSLSEEEFLGDEEVQFNNCDCDSSTCDGSHCQTED